MDYVLSKNLPPELVDDICKRVHKSYMEDICKEIKYCIVWIRLKNEMPSFLIGRITSNYYAILDYDNIMGVKTIVIPY